MRKNLLLTVILGGAFFSCAKEVLVDEPAAGQAEQSEKTWTVSIEAAKGEGTVTKVTFGDDGWIEEDADAAVSEDVTTKGLELEGGNYLKSTWEFKEKVFVYNGGTLVGELESQGSGGNSTRLAGSITGSYKVGDILNLYLIGPEDERSYIGQKGTIEDIAQNFNYARGQVQIKSIDSESGAITFSSAYFNNLQSINEFSFGVLKVKSLTISGAGIVGRNDAEAYVTVTPETPSNKLYVAISNNKAGVKIPYEFTAVTDDGTTVHQTKKAALVDGKFYSTSINRLSLYDAASTPLTIEALESGHIQIKNENNLTIRWTVNSSDINDIQESSSNPVEIPVILGDKVEFHCQNEVYGQSSASPFNISCNVAHYVYGNITSLRDGWNFHDTTGNPALKTVGNYAYKNMFLDNSKMFNHPCKDILLPATSLGRSCYNGMFSGCTGLTSVPELPATSLSHSCYYGMFSGCTGLTSVPENLLPAKEINFYSYAEMFQGCTGLTSLPENLLPAFEVNSYSYAEMFQGCTGLTSLPENLLPATLIGGGSCYQAMFKGCTGLTSVPKLPAKRLMKSCYQEMFLGCTGLTLVPENMLPAEELAEACYFAMFYGCTNLEKAPVLPAKKAATACYNEMFTNCSSLRDIRCYLEYVTSRHTFNWVNGVQDRGNFYRHYRTNWVRGVNGIPQNWRESPVDPH